MKNDLKMGNHEIATVVDNTRFSNREIEIIKLICMEMTNKQIAQNIHLSLRTVEWYKEQLLLKTDSKNMVGIVLYAIKNKIVNL